MWNVYFFCSAEYLFIYLLFLSPQENISILLYSTQQKCLFILNQNDYLNTWQHQISIQILMSGCEDIFVYSFTDAFIQMRNITSNLL